VLIGFSVQGKSVLLSRGFLIDGPGVFHNSKTMTKFESLTAQPHGECPVCS
jgi:hypothetical protein